jgi:hypothetical protein
MKWIVDFYHQRRAIVARYEVDAPSAATAVVLGRRAVLSQYSPPAARRDPGLFERAERIGGREGMGWVVCRIAGLSDITASNDGAHGTFLMPDGPIGRRRSCPRVAPRSRESSEVVESFLPNAWPVGLRTMPCLACDAPFVSSGRHERLCASCRRHKE